MEKETMVPFTREEKIKAFIHDYYFGYGTAVTLMRLVAGPVMLLLGLLMSNPPFDLRWVVILYGGYYILKPYLWVLFRLSQYQTEYVWVEVSEDNLVLKDNLGNESSMVWDSFKEIKDLSFYFLFIITTTQRIRLPKRLFSDEDKEILQRKLG